MEYISFSSFQCRAKPVLFVIIICSCTLWLAFTSVSRETSFTFLNFQWANRSFTRHNKFNIASWRNKELPQFTDNSTGPSSDDKVPFNDRLVQTDAATPSERLVEANLLTNRTKTNEMDFSEVFECGETCQEIIQQHRQRILQDSCHKKPINGPPSLWNKTTGHLNPSEIRRLGHIYPIHSMGVLFCTVPKCGSSTWKKLMLAAIGRIETPQSYKGDIHPLFRRVVKSLGKYSADESEEMLKTYKKFVIVRDPMQRMLSLFLDKAVGKHDLKFNESQFEGFLKFILKSPNRFQSVGFDEHWTHTSYLCLPCDINYNFIGRLETSQRDTKYIFDHFLQKAKGNYSLTLRPTKHETNSTAPEKKSQYFSQVNREILHAIVKKYGIDYDNFGYDRNMYRLFKNL
ncbi:carbohydrate sulfotransferase 11-like isoform X3 [Apostichopus japonicus]|uniref:carbohydrate sulfotransferase 11-like isoform X3 n=1 Tax=Stichopus japonicus TaxID=307972 RepID=UPI003AB76664